MATTAVLNLGLNTAQFNRGLSKASSKLNLFKGSSLAVIGGVTAGLAAGAAAIGFSFIKAAADADETTNKFKAVFAGINKEADETAKNLAKNFGLSSREAEKLLGDTGDLLSGFGFATDSALKFSNQVQELASDLTSFQNFQGGVEGASQAITAALTGETEKMKALGVVIRQGTTEYKNNVKALMQNKGLTELQAKATENLRIITEQSKNSIGDFAKTSKQMANQLKQTGKIWDDLKISVGRFLSEFIVAESLTLKFNKSFAKLTKNIQVLLKNGVKNWSVFKKWMGDNIVTMFTKDLPHAISTMIKNYINNMGVAIKVFVDLWLTFEGWFIGFVSRLFSEGMSNALTTSLKEMFISMKDWALQVWDSLVAIFKGKSDTVAGEFSKKLNEGIKAGLDGEGLLDLVGNVLSEGAKKLKGPFDGFETSISKLELVMSSFADQAKELGLVGLTASEDSLSQWDEILNKIDKSKIEPIKEEDKKQAIAQRSEMGAFEQSSVDAFRIINQSEGNKTEKKIENNTKETVKAIQSMNRVRTVSIA